MSETCIWWRSANRLAALLFHTHHFRNSIQRSITTLCDYDISSNRCSLDLLLLLHRFLWLNRQRNPFLLEFTICFCCCCYFIRLFLSSLFGVRELLAVVCYKPIQWHDVQHNYYSPLNYFLFSQFLSFTPILTIFLCLCLCFGCYTYNNEHICWGSWLARSHSFHRDRNLHVMWYGFAFISTLCQIIVSVCALEMFIHTLASWSLLCAVRIALRFIISLVAVLPIVRTINH